MPVKVVTDSSARLHPDELQRWGIEHVPLHVLVDGKDMRDGIDQVPYDVYARVIESFEGGTAKLRYGGDMALGPLPQARRPTSKVKPLARNRSVSAPFIAVAGVRTPPGPGRSSLARHNALSPSMTAVAA